MKTVTLDVRSPADAMADFTQAWETGKPQRSARISFATPELLWKVLTEKPWELLRALCGAGPVSIREAARRVGRDVKAVHGDVTALLNAALRLGSVLWAGVAGKLGHYSRKQRLSRRTRSES